MIASTSPRLSFLASAFLLGWLLLPLLPCSSLCTGVRAQVTDSVAHVRETNRFNKEMFNRQDPSGTLERGGTFYVSNPAPTYEVDSKIAYLWQEFKVLDVRLITGDTVRVNGRLRLPDQKFEIMRPDGVYELDNQKIQLVSVPESGREFVFYFDMRQKRRGLYVYEQLYDGGEQKLWVLREAGFVDSKPHSMFDTSEQVTKLKRKETVFLVENKWGTKVTSTKQLLGLLGAGKGSAAANYAKRKKLKNDPEDLAELLRFVRERGAEQR